MQTSEPKFLINKSFTLAAIVGLAAATHAATYTWTGAAGDGVWQTGVSAANWTWDSSVTGFTPGNGGSNSYVFAATGANSPTITLLNGHNPNIANMTVNAAAANTTFVVDGASHLDFQPTADGGETLSVNGNSNAVINATNGGTVQLFTYNENAWRISSGTFTINAPIVGSGAGRGISKRGGGTLVLNGASTFGGELVAADGTIQIGSIGNIGETSAAGTGSGIANGQIQISRTTSASHLNGTLVYTGGDAASNRAILIAKDTSATPGTDFANFTTTGGTLTLSGGVVTSGIGVGADGHFTEFNVGGAGNMVFNDNANNTGGIFGDMNFNKVGAGTVSVNVDSLWRGNTTVQAGTLNINANHTVVGGGTYDVQAGGTLGGDGAIAGAITVDAGGTLAGGDSLNVTSVQLNGTYSANLLSNKTSFGSVVDSGAFTIDPAATLNVLADTTLALGQTFTIIDTNNNLVGTFAGLADGAQFFAGPNAYEIHYTNGDVTLTTVVPEPATLSLLALAGATALRRRRR